MGVVVAGAQGASGQSLSGFRLEGWAAWWAALTRLPVGSAALGADRRGRGHGPCAARLLLLLLQEVLLQEEEEQEGQGQGRQERHEHEAHAGRPGRRGQAALPAGLVRGEPRRGTGHLGLPPAGQRTSQDSEDWAPLRPSPGRPAQKGLGGVPCLLW